MSELWIPNFMAAGTSSPVVPLGFIVTFGRLWRDGHQLSFSTD